MGFFKTIQAIFSDTGLVSTVGKGIDKAIFTDEEKSDAWMLLIQAYHPFKLAQRYIALGLLFLMGIGFLASAAVRIIGSALCDPVMMQGANDTIIYYKWWIEDSAWLATTTIAMFGEPFLYAVAFFFAGGTMNGVVELMAKRRNRLMGIKQDK